MKIYYSKIFYGNKGIYLYDAIYNTYKIISEKFSEILNLNEKDFYKNINYYNGYIKLNDIRDMTIPIDLKINHDYTKSLINRFRNSFKMLTLSVTNECNMDCTYCIYHEKFSQNENIPKHMSWEIAKKAMDEMIKQSSNLSNLHLGFYGGECLVDFEFIKKCVEYFKNQDIGITKTFGLTTNGTLLYKKEIRDFLSQNNFFTLISLDGPKKIHDRYRIMKNGDKTFEKIIRNLTEWYKESQDYVKNYVRLNAVCAPPYNSFVLDDYFKNFPVNIDYGNLVSTPFFEKNVNDCNNNYMKLLSCRENKTYSENFEKLDLYSYSYYHDMKENVSYDSLKDEIYEMYIPGGPCLPYLRIYVNTEGKYYPCEKVTESEDTCIGDVDTGINVDKILKIMDDYVNIARKKCKNCWAMHLCGVCHANINSSCINKKKRIEEDFIYYVENIKNNRNYMKILDLKQG